MEEGLKRRLVGAAVLASLAVIFVPMLIDDPNQDDLDLDPIPRPPQQAFSQQLLDREVTPPTPLPRPVNVAELPPEDRTPPASGASREGDDATSQAASPPEAAAGPKPGQAESREPLVAWMVQAGSFSNRENAQKLVARLRNAGFQAPAPGRARIGGKVRYRVLVGPMVEKQKAERQLPEINRISGAKGMIVRFR